MMATFLDAAASYYGLGETAARKLELFTDGSDLVLAVEVRVTDDDMAGILARMNNMRQLEKARQQPQAEPIMPSEQRMRSEYTAMDRVTKSQFGSFSVYRAWRLGQDNFVAGEADRVELPPYVYLSPAECTPQQKAMAIGQDQKGNYAVAVEDLTAEQRKAFEEAPSAVVQARAAHDRLNGADGKPTSNADDFGGVPG